MVTLTSVGIDRLDDMMQYMTVPQIIGSVLIALVVILIITFIAVKLDNSNSKEDDVTNNATKTDNE